MSAETTQFLLKIGPFVLIAVILVFVLRRQNR
jgi:hypothetical protein